MRALLAGALGLALAAAACGDDGGDLDAFCETAEAGADLGGTFATFDATDAEATAAQFAEAADGYRRLRELAPSEVRDDVGALLAFAEDFRDALGEVDPADPSGATGVAVAFEDRFAEVERATDRLDAFVADDCAAREG